MILGTFLAYRSYMAFSTSILSGDDAPSTGGGMGGGPFGYYGANADAQAREAPQHQLSMGGGRIIQGGQVLGGRNTGTGRPITQNTRLFEGQGHHLGSS